VHVLAKKGKRRRQVSAPASKRYARRFACVSAGVYGF
jgi:hypothetical protein